MLVNQKTKDIKDERMCVSCLYKSRLVVLYSGEELRRRTFLGGEGVHAHDDGDGHCRSSGLVVVVSLLSVAVGCWEKKYI